MKKEQIKLGGTYLAKVTDKVVPVRLDAENPHGGWDATNLVTNKKVRIKSAQRLRGPAPERDAKQRAKAVAESQAADASINAHAVPAEAAAPAMQTRAKKMAAEPKARKPSGLDAACEVLKARGEPMTCKAIVEEMLARGMWATGGKTPASTLHAAICREIQAKAGEARFKKTDRGQFTINAK
jgi:hypothetical protein